MTSKKNISKTSVIVISIVLLTGLFLDSLPPLLQTVVAQVQNSDKSVTNNQVINQVPAQVSKENPGTNTAYLYQQLLTSLATPGALGTSTNGGTKALPGIPNSVAFPADSQLVDFDFLHGLVIVRLGPQGGPNLPLPSNADIRFGPDSKPIGVVCPNEFPCGQIVPQSAATGVPTLQSAATGVAVPQSAATGESDAGTSTPAKSGQAGPGTSTTAAPAPAPGGPETSTTAAGLPATPSTIEEYLPTRDQMKEGFNELRTKTNCKVTAILLCAMAGGLSGTVATPAGGLAIGAACLYAANAFCDERFKEEEGQASTDCYWDGKGKPPACEPTSGPGTTKTTTTTTTPAPEPAGTSTTKPDTTDATKQPAAPTTEPATTPSGCNPSTQSCIPSSGAPAGTTTTAPVSPVNTPAPSGNIGGLGAQITAGETSTTPAPILSEPQPHLPPQTNIIDGLDPSRSELTEKQLTELFGESVTSMEPDSGSNSDSSPDQKTIIIEKETAEETVDGGMPAGSDQVTIVEESGTYGGSQQESAQLQEQESNSEASSVLP